MPGKSQVLEAGRKSISIVVILIKPGALYANRYTKPSKYLVGQKIIKFFFGARS
jgi:hypothetical protein